MVRVLVAALVAVNAVMFLVFVGAAGSTQQALRMLDPRTVGACATAAGVSAPAAAELIDHDTIRFRARDDEMDGVMVSVSCTLEDDAPVDVEVAP